MDENTMPAAEQNTDPVQPEATETNTYTVNNVPVTEAQPQYQQAAPQPDYQQPQYQQPQYQQPQYQQPVYQQPYPVNNAPADPGKSNATAAMILGLVSCFFSPTVIIGIGCGIAALVLAMKSKKASLAVGLQPGTEQKVGFITGIIGTIISGIALLISFFALILPLLIMLLAAPFAALAY